MARRVVQDEGCLEEFTQADDLPKEEPEDQREPQAQEVEVMLLSVINVFSTALGMSARLRMMREEYGNPYIITNMSGEIENLTPWSGFDHDVPAVDADSSGYTASMWDAVWSSGLWTQTRAEELLQDARDYFDEVIVNASEQDRQG